MNIDLYQIIITLAASAVSGMATAAFSIHKTKKQRAEMVADKARDNMLLEIKDLQIKLYKLEKDLSEWKEKYYEAIQELIRVKSELEETVIKLSHAEIHLNQD
jgi:hypothetical protein